MARYAQFLAAARLEQVLTDILADEESPSDVADQLVGYAAETTFLPRRRQIQITFDLPTDDGDDAPDA